MPIDYKALWEELINELSYLDNHHIKEIHPKLMTEYMGLMVDKEEARKDEKPS